MDFKRQYEAYEQSKRVIKIVDNKELAERLNAKIGDEYSILPLPETKEEAFEYLEKYKAIKFLDIYVRRFLADYGKNIRTLTDRLNEILEFIEQADQLSTMKTFKNVGRNHGNRFHYEYSKWVNGHYHNAEYTYDQNFFSIDLPDVIAQYVLFKEWIETEIENIRNEEQFEIFKENLPIDIEKLEPLKDDLEVNIFHRSEHPELFKIKVPEKWAALLYLIELAVKNESPPENSRGDLAKSEIIKIGQQRGYKKAQYFYINVRDTNLEKPNAIATEYNDNWKQKIITYSNNNEEVVTFLKEKYDSDSLG